MTLYRFYLYCFLFKENKTTTKIVRAMNPVLFILLALIALSSYAHGYILSFEERCELYPKPFANDVKPVWWNRTNHDMCKLSQQAQLSVIIVFLITSMLYLEDMIIPLWLYIITLAVVAVAPEILGSCCGKRGCDRMTQKMHKT